MIDKSQYTRLIVPLFLSVVGLSCAMAQDVKPLKPTAARTDYSFPIRPGGTLYHFRVVVDSTSTVKGFAVFRDGSDKAFQTLPICHQEIPEQLTEYDHDLELVRHADLNFDGFQDLELLVWSSGHLEKKLYCIYLWNPTTSRFLYSPEATDAVGADPVPDPATKTIATFSDFLFGDYQSSTFQWADGKLVLTSTISMTNADDGSGCFNYSCSALVKGKMVQIIEKQLCSGTEYDKPPECSSSGP